MTSKGGLDSKSTHPLTLRQLFQLKYTNNSHLDLGFCFGSSGLCSPDQALGDDDIAKTAIGSKRSSHQVTILILYYLRERFTNLYYND